MTVITETGTGLTGTDIEMLDAYWRAANYLSPVDRSTCSTTLCSGNRCGPSTSSRGCSATGGRRLG